MRRDGNGLRPDWRRPGSGLGTGLRGAPSGPHHATESGGARDAEAGLRVLAAPAFSQKGNPLTSAMASALVRRGLAVRDLTRSASFLSAVDVVHVHWPQAPATGPLIRAVLRSCDFVGRLIAQRLRGARLVWTAHNVHAHDQPNPRLEKALMSIVVALLNGVIFLTESSRAEAYETYPRLRSLPSELIPHPLYAEAYPDEIAQFEARKAFGLAPEGKVLGFIGDIKPYKGLETFLAAVRELPPGEVQILIAGAFRTEPAYAERMRDLMARLKQEGHALVVREDRLSEAEMIAAICASDRVALPYSKIANSGFAVLVLEKRRPLLTADTALFREMRDALGTYWVQIAEGDWRGSSLSRAIAVEQQPGDAARLGAFLSEREIDNTAARTIAFYNRLIGRRHDG